MAGERRSTEERRTQIAEAALALIGRDGIGALTMARLAEEVEMTAGALFRHFESRDAILEEVARRVEELVSATFPPADAPPIERLVGLVRSRSRAVGANPGLAKLLFSEQFTLALPPKAKARLRALVGWTRSYVAEALAEAAAQGRVRSDVPPDELAVVVLGTIQILAFLGAGGGPRGSAPEPARIEEVLLTLLTPVPKAR